MSVTRHARIPHFISYFILLMYPYFKFVTFNNYPVLRGEVLIPASIWLVTSYFLSTIRNKVGIIFLYLLLFFIFFSTGERHLKAVELVALGFFCAGLLVFFWFQFEALHKVVLIFLAGMILSEVGIFSYHSFVKNPITASHGLPASASSPSKLKHVLYLILDEHMGIAGLSQNIPVLKVLQEKLEKFYQDNGFTLYTKAFSNYYDTDDSIPNTLNFSLYDKRRYFFDGSSGRDLKENKVFDFFASRNYRIHVYQADYINFFDPHWPIDKCYQYSKNSIHAISNQPYSVWEKMWVISSEFIAANSIYAKFDKKMKDHNLLKTRTGPLGTIPELLTTLQTDIVSSAQPTLFFVHLLMPHGAFVYDSACKPRPVREWEEGREYGLWYSQIKNSEEAYARKYKLYAEQTECLNMWLQNLFGVLKEKGLYDGMTIVLHGDHGARIQRYHEPYYEFVDQIDGNDMRVAFSTLFAVKKPNQKEGEIISLKKSIIELLPEAFGLSQKIDRDVEKDIFFKGNTGNTLFKVPSSKIKL